MSKTDAYGYSPHPIPTVAGSAGGRRFVGGRPIDVSVHSKTSEYQMDRNHEPEGIPKPDLIIVVANRVRFRLQVIEKRSWYPIRLDDNRLDALKWIAFYSISPVLAITHLAKILSISPYRNSGKYQINFMEPLELINSVRLDSGYVARFAGHRYSWEQRLLGANFISDLKPWG